MFIQNPAQKLAALSFIMMATVGPALAQQGAPALAPPLNRSLNGDFLRTSQVLGAPTSFCGHVIDLMMNVRILQRSGQSGHTGPVALPHLSVGVNPGDLELLGVHLVCEGDTAKGPVFQIDMKNSSQVPIGNFHVSLVGVLGRIHPHSPSATVRIPRMEPGQCTQIQIQLPLTCMTMGGTGQTSGFDTLIVALDSYDELIECNEVNNLLIVNRCDVALLAPVPAEPPQAALQAPAVPDAGPNSPEGVRPDNPKTSPLDEIDVDDLESGTTPAAAFRLSRD